MQQYKLWTIGTQIQKTIMKVISIYYTDSKFWAEDQSSSSSV